MIYWLYQVDGALIGYASWNVNRACWWLVTLVVRVLA